MTVRELTWQEAEQLAGKRLDRRCKFASDGEHVLGVVRFTRHCTGCCELGSYMEGSHLYPYDKKAECHVGAGCGECGYTGKVRWSHWVPLTVIAASKAA